MTKQTSIKKICNLPLDFKMADKSAWTLLQESKFADFSSEITIQDIRDYLSKNKNLIDDWINWSEDKRTQGYYLSICADKYLVGLLDKDSKEEFSKYFPTAEEACAEFILREVCDILDIKWSKLE